VARAGKRGKVSEREGNLWGGVAGQAIVERGGGGDGRFRRLRRFGRRRAHLLRRQGASSRPPRFSFLGCPCALWRLFCLRWVELVQKMRASVVSGGGSGGERIGFSKKNSLPCRILLVTSRLRLCCCIWSVRLLVCYVLARLLRFISPILMKSDYGRTPSLVDWPVQSG
jgi:hypothetical protein